MRQINANVNCLGSPPEGNYFSMTVGSDLVLLLWEAAKTLRFGREPRQRELLKFIGNFCLIKEQDASV
jgi:hypothetical protein